MGSGDEIINHHAKQLTLDRSRLQCRQEHIVSIDDKYTLRQVENTEYGNDKIFGIKEYLPNNIVIP